MISLRAGKYWQALELLRWCLDQSLSEEPFGGSLWPWWPSDVCVSCQIYVVTRSLVSAIYESRQTFKRTTLSSLQCASPPPTFLGNHYSFLSIIAECQQPQSSRLWSQTKPMLLHNYIQTNRVRMLFGALPITGRGESRRGKSAVGRLVKRKNLRVSISQLRFRWKRVWLIYNFLSIEPGA